MLPQEASDEVDNQGVRPFSKGCALFLVGFLVLALISVPLLGGRITRLAGVQVRAPWLVLTALAVQVLVVSVIAGAHAGVLAVLHVASYVMLGWFIWLNRRIPGLLILGAGWAMNALVIAVNGGVMPASSRVVESGSRGAGTTGEFLNSRPLASPRLAFLGDNFALPETWPLHNVFSIGDVFIALGAFVALHWLCDSLVARLWRHGTRRFALRARPTTSV